MNKLLKIPLLGLVLRLILCAFIAICHAVGIVGLKLLRRYAGWRYARTQRPYFWLIICQIDEMLREHERL